MILPCLFVFTLITSRAAARGTEPPQVRRCAQRRRITARKNNRRSLSSQVTRYRGYFSTHGPPCHLPVTLRQQKDRSSLRHLRCVQPYQTEHNHGRDSNPCLPLKRGPHSPLCYHGSDSFRVIYKVKTLRPCRAIPLSPLIRELHPYSRVVRSHTLRRSYFLHGF